MFESGAGCNYQVQYVRDRRAVPITRDYMVEAERRYREIAQPPVAAVETVRRKKSGAVGPSRRKSRKLPDLV
jgi:cyclopropane-fatty-acyl-phospholipid synthase